MRRILAGAAMVLGVALMGAALVGPRLGLGAGSPAVAVAGGGAAGRGGGGSGSGTAFDVGAAAAAISGAAGLLGAMIRPAPRAAGDRPSDALAAGPVAAPAPPPAAPGSGAADAPTAPRPGRIDMGPPAPRGGGAKFVRVGQ